MGASLNGTAQEAAGRKTGPTFPGDAQASLFRPDPPSWTAFVRWVVRAHVKQIASRVYTESDPDQAADNLYRILEGRHKRHFAIDWLDHVFAEVPEAAEAFVFFVCDRLGYERPARKPDPVRAEERVERLEKRAGELVEAAGDIARELAEIRREKRR